MRKVSEDARNAFESRKRFSSSNTKVVIENGEARMYLFNNLIAKTENGDTFICDGGHQPSNTTRDRLNAFRHVNLRISKGQFILNEKRKWDGEWINIFEI
jgi:hypothetical protein